MPVPCLYSSGSFTCVFLEKVEINSIVCCRKDKLQRFSDSVSHFSIFSALMCPLPPPPPRLPLSVCLSICLSLSLSLSLSPLPPSLSLCLCVSAPPHPPPPPPPPPSLSVSVPARAIPKVKRHYSIWADREDLCRHTVAGLRKKESQMVRGWGVARGLPQISDFPFLLVNMLLLIFPHAACTLPLRKHSYMITNTAICTRMKEMPIGGPLQKNMHPMWNEILVAAAWSQTVKLSDLLAKASD